MKMVLTSDEEEEHRKADNRGVDLKRNKPNNPLDVPVITNTPCKSSECNYAVPLFLKEDQISVVSHIDFILGNQPMNLKDCVQMVQIQELKHEFVESASNQALNIKRGNA